MLKPSDMHVFTIPWYPGLKSTVKWAKQGGDQVIHLCSQVYNDKPIA